MVKSKAWKVVANIATTFEINADKEVDAKQVITFFKENWEGLAASAFSFSHIISTEPSNEDLRDT